MKSTLSINTQDKAAATNLIALFIVCFAGNMFAGVVSTLMSVYLPVVVKELRGGQSDSQLNDISGYINSIFIFGWAAGGFLWGVISDKTGRKASLLLSIACFGIFTLLTGLMNNWWSVVVCRFLSGVGSGGLLVVTFTLISEVWPEKTRAIATGILSISIPVGIFSAGMISYLVSSWREGFMIGIIPVAIAVAGYWVITESELWLNDRSDRSSLLAVESRLFHSENIAALATGSLIFGTMLIGMWAIFSWTPTWIQSLLTTDAHKEGGISMMFLGMGGLTGGFFSGWLVNLVGLRRSLVASFAVCIVLSFVLFKTNSTFSVIIYPEIAVIALFFGVSQGVLSLYIPLLFHTSIRASATGFCFNIGRIVTATAVLTVGMLVTALGGYGNALFIFSLVFIIGLLAVVLIKNIQPGTQHTTQTQTDGTY
jgi:predicted MFS family arabinose efflux permease